MNLKIIVERFLCIFFPKRCKYCGTVIVPQETVCNNCKDDLPVIEQPVCYYCGYSKKDCICKNKKSYYDKIIAAYYYKGPIIKAIDRMKFQERKFVCEVMAQDMSDAVRTNYSDINFNYVTFVPFSQEDKKTREFNHSEVIARHISNNLNIEFADLIKQIYDKPTQHLLSSKDRKGNVFGIYDVENINVVNGKTILLVDDIKTTGSTLDECSKMLKLAGAENVCCVVFAITKKDKQKQIVEKSAK